MAPTTVRTRFAPSPTGFMHIGNLRSALYEYLVAKSQQGQFVLRLEDTDRERYVAGAEQIIYQTLATVGLKHDEGPDIGGPYAPYIQSERLNQYLKPAQELIAKGSAYYVFNELAPQNADQTELSDTADKVAKDKGAREFNEQPFQIARFATDDAPGYLETASGDFVALSEEEIAQLLQEGKKYIIRQRMPRTGETSFSDEVFGTITVENKELEDQILLKSDGFPTYNFANVIDDHAMEITHVVRGSEYLSSTPKYNLLYEALGYPLPTYIHLPLILGTDGKKLSKRHGATSFADLVAEGYLPEAITNYIAFLGWAPGDDTREIFSLAELEQVFSAKGIGKAPAVFDYEKLRWYNEQYIRQMDKASFIAYIEPTIKQLFADQFVDLDILAEVLPSRLSKLSDLKEMLTFATTRQALSTEIFTHKKSKLTPALSQRVLKEVVTYLENEPDLEREELHNFLMSLGEKLELKTGQIMGPVRIGLARQQVTPGGATELVLLLGQKEATARLREALDFLNALPEA